MDTSKIIRGVVNNGRYTVTAPIVKEDYGLYLKIEGVELPSTYEVDFSNSENNGTSVTMIGNSDGVLIPRQFIDSGKDVFAFLYHVGEDFGRTVYKFRIPNKVRPDRTDETPTPEEQSVIDQAISALNEAVAQTAQDVISADQSAQSAQGYAEQAEDARDNAQTYANNAQASATSASQSAQASSNSAAASAQSAGDAETARQATTSLAAEAQGYASASAQSASASANSASQAQGYAQSASASAQSASGYASQADISANTASAKASEASTSASTASAKATESAQSATSAQRYAQTAEQAKTASQTAQGLAEGARDTAVQAKTDAESARDDAVQAKEDAESAVASISGALDDKAPVITDTASGAIASFTDGADDLPLKSLVVDINPVQDLHGQDSPYPAGGGKNLIYKTLKKVNINADGKITSYNAYDVFCAKVESGKTYTISIDGVATRSVDAGYFAEDPVLGSTTYDGNRILNLQATFEATYTGFIGFRFDADTANVQFEEGSTATSYAPYENICPISGWTQVNVNHSDADMTNPTTITIDLGQTVYGAKLYPLEGKAVVDRVFATKKWGQMTSVYSGNTHSAKSLNFDADVLKGGQNSITNITATYIERTTMQSTHYYIGSILKTVYVVLPNDTDTDTDIQVCGTLVEPITVQLTPNQINSLYGVNNLWADSGDTEVEYRADTKLYISKKIAEAISALS